MNAIRAMLAALAIVTAPELVRADEVADFYKGKTVQIVVGYGSGGGYDLYARMLARHMGRHIPGSPAMVVQNMPGAGSLRAANYLYSVAAKDGTVFGIFARNMPLLGVIGGNPAVQFDPRKYTWLGSSSSYQEDAYLLFVRPDAPARSIEELRRPGGPVLTLGGTGEGATGNDVTVLLKDVLGINVKLVSGYPDSNALYIAIDRGELDGRITDMSSVRANRAHWLKQPGGMNVLLQFARQTRHANFPDVPTARELAPDDRARALIEMAELPYLLSRPFAGPPGIPEPRAKALQAAFRAVHTDKELLAEAAKLQLGISPVHAEEVPRLLDNLAAQPKELLDYMRKLQDMQKQGG